MPSALNFWLGSTLTSRRGDRDDAMPMPAYPSPARKSSVGTRTPLFDEEEEEQGCHWHLSALQLSRSNSPDETLRDRQDRQEHSVAV
jgi:hypothetical protein